MVRLKLHLQGIHDSSNIGSQSHMSDLYLKHNGRWKEMSLVRLPPKALIYADIGHATGPYSVPQLQQWRGTGFFGGPSCENVELRNAPGQGEEGSIWGTWADVVGL